MATATSTGSGSWSGAIWSGGSGAGGAPADGDAVTIAAGHNVLMDSDLSAWTGLFTVTITGGVTPGMLYFMDGTSGHLKIRTGYNLVGTTDTNKGRLSVNSDGVWGNTGALAFANKAVIDLQGTSQITATNLDIRLYCTQPTNLYVATYGTKKTVTGSASADTLTNAGHGWANATALMVKVTGGSLPAPLEADTIYWVVNTATDTFKLAYVSGGTAIDLTTDGSGTIEAYDGHSDTGTATMNVLTDVTGDTPWTATDGHDRAVLADAGPTDYDQQRVQLTTINAGTIVLSANVDSPQYPGARIYLASRNVSIRSTGTSSSQPIIATPTSCVFQCEIINTAGSGTTFYGYGISGAITSTISGTVSGINLGVSSSSSYNTISGIVMACSSGISSGIANIISGSVVGCSVGLVSCNANTISGTIAGCSSGLTSSNKNIISGSINGCTNALNLSNGNIVNGTISRCRFPIYTSLENIITGNVESYEGFRFPLYGKNFLRNALLIPSAIALYSRNTAYCYGRIHCENLNRINGNDIIYDAFGDIKRVACGTSGDYPAQDPDGGTGDILSAENLQSNLSTVNPLVIFDEFRIWLSAAAHTVTFKVQTTFAGISAGGLTLTANYIGTDGVRTDTTNAPAISQRSSTTDWTQTLAVTFTPTVAGWADFKLVLTEYESGNEVFVWPEPVIT